ncbi:ISAs1 family transposase [Photorhabdus tasmaniensis]|uniref:ISAs1 family transposase n=1 Tax=Photorhabdus tasmaniensis TaxID=1004159 RepID=UPI00404248EE
MSIFNYLSVIPDPCKEINKKHELMDVLFLVFATVLSGACGWKSIQDFGETQLEWLKKYSSLSSLSVDAEQVAKAIRSHWGIENQWHWILDVIFREDELSISDPVGAAHMALFNRVSLSLLKQQHVRSSSSDIKRAVAFLRNTFRFWV